MLGMRNYKVGIRNEEQQGQVWKGNLRKSAQSAGQFIKNIPFHCLG